MHVKPLPAAGGLILVGFFYHLLKAASLADFLLYWASGRLFMQGQNPYDPEALLSLINRIEILQYPFVNWLPPWAIAFVVPFSLLPHGVSGALWFTIQVLLIFWLADWFWRFSGGARSRRGIAWLAVVLFMPLLHAFSFGQLNLFVLAGILLFIRTSQANQYALAGASLFLVALKPHLVYLFLFLVVLWSVRKRLWILPAVALGSLVATLAAASFLWSSALSDYAAAIGTRHGPFIWMTPTVGTALWRAFDSSSLVLRFAPSIAGFLFGLILWGKRLKRGFSWEDCFVPVLLLSVCTSAYAWAYDAALLLPAVLVMLVWFAQDMRRLWWIPVSLFVLELGSYFLMAYQGNQFYAFWFPWTLMLLYYIGRERVASHAPESITET